jgi:DnaJ domain
LSELFAAAVSIAPTRRRRFLWAVWWTAPPVRAPFRKPDAAEGGARSHAEALRQAERAASRPLVEIEPVWARAWARVLVGQEPFIRSETADRPRARARVQTDDASIWHILGVDPRATVADIKRAFRAQALVAHPDHGGQSDAFRTLRRAYDEALRRRRRRRKS